MKTPPMGNPNPPIANNVSAAVESHTSTPQYTTIPQKNHVQPCEKARKPHRSRAPGRGGTEAVVDGMSGWNESRGKWAHSGSSFTTDRPNCTAYPAMSYEPAALTCMATAAN